MIKNILLWKVDYYFYIDLMSKWDILYLEIYVNVLKFLNIISLWYKNRRNIENVIMIFVEVRLFRRENDVECKYFW